MRLSHCLVAAVFGLFVVLMTGCCPQVRLETDPVGAHLYLQEMKDGQLSEPKSIGTAPLTQGICVPENGSVRVIAKMPQFRDAVLEINSKTPEKYYQIKLERYLVSISNIVWEPEIVQHRPVLMKLVPHQVMTEAYVDTSERSQFVKNCTVLPTNKDAANINYIAASPTEDKLIFQNIFIAHPSIDYTVTAEKEKPEQVALKHDMTLLELKSLNDITEKELKDGFERGRVVHIADMQYGSNLWQQGTHGAAFTPVTTDKALNLFPAYMPTGEMVVFASTRLSPNLLLWHMRSDAGNAEIGQVTQSQAEDYRPSTGPDGRIAFTSLPPGVDTPQVWTVMPDGGRRTQLPDGEMPRISPDGRRIAFVRQHTGVNHARQLWTMAIDGGDQRQLTQNTAYTIIDPCWSPDGRWIAYASNQGRDERNLQNFDIWICAADGSKHYQITTNGSWDDCPTWDRSGNALYFRSSRGGAWRIWKADLTLP